MARPRHSLPTLALSVLIVACTAGDQSGGTQAASAVPVAEAKPLELTITGADFAFTGRDTVPAGETEVHLMNHGPSMHHIQFIRLDAGHSFAELMSGMAQPGPMPSWAHMVGGPNAAPPGAETSAFVDLEPGSYAMVCLIPAADGTPHMAKGMARAFTVTAAQGSSAAPAADDTVRLVDYAFEPTTPLTAGHHVIRVENAAQQPHEMVLVRLAEGHSAADVVQWVHDGMQGQPPGVPVGGVTGLEPGASNEIAVDLEPGEYAFLCFFPDAKDGKEHVAHGMMQQFSVS